MDLTAFLPLYSPPFLLTTIFIILLTKLFFPKNTKNLPPGPPCLPVIGNLHQVVAKLLPVTGNLQQVGAKLHVSMANFAREYGPLISLRLGNQLLVVASSPEAAMGILKTHDQLLSARAVPMSFKRTQFLPHSLVWSDCDQTWRTLKALCRTELFSPKALEAQSSLRNEKIRQLVDFLRKKQGEVIDIEDVVFTTLFNTMSSIILGKDVLDLNDEHGTCDMLKESIHKSIDYAGRIIDFASFYPMLERFDLHGIRRGNVKYLNIVFDHWKDTIEERRSQVNSPSWSSEQAHTFLDRLLEKGFSNNQINELITELFLAGTNTTTSTVIWGMSELVRHQEMMSRIEEEVKKEINSHEITNFHLSKLSYLHAFIKESFRLHPPVPFLIPHRAGETCEVMNYTIPKNAKIIVNVWAMGRDSNIWNEPLSFKPERFMDSKLDFKGQNFELIPFGSGRRMCPGLPSGVHSVELILASLVREFDWALPNGDDPLKLDMNGKFGIALKREVPLKLIFTQKKAY